MNFQFLKLITGIVPITWANIAKCFGGKNRKEKIVRDKTYASEAWKRIYHDDDGNHYRLIDNDGYVYKVDRAGTKTPVLDRNGRIIRSDSI